MLSNYYHKFSIYFRIFFYAFRRQFTADLQKTQWYSGRKLLHVFQYYRSDVDAHTHAEVIKTVFIDIGQLFTDSQSVIRHSDYVLEIPHIAGAFC